QLTIDTNTINRELKLSEDNRKVTRVKELQSYPDHPDRFDVDLPQVLCRDGLTGRCYWEVEWRKYVKISVSYRRIRRKGNSKDCWFGLNDQSWILSCSERSDGYSAWHKDIGASFSSTYTSNRVAVYVDCPAGILSFYRVSSDSLIHLHTFNTTFTEDDGLRSAAEILQQVDVQQRLVLLVIRIANMVLDLEDRLGPIRSSRLASQSVRELLLLCSVFLLQEAGGTTGRSLEITTST
ncbi:stonustoxin subunit alpha-like, partial [Fundulus heteroclitus]|uniref:stonustoxin subunit alpha-like n=1 Tax=Fundulus heteroclitus TaxID=8078 RepID=UPI00165A653C